MKEDGAFFFSQFGKKSTEAPPPRTFWREAGQNSPLCSSKGGVSCSVLNIKPLNQLSKLSKPCVVVFGGSGGIGSAICRKYVSCGYLTIAVDIDECGGARLSEELGELCVYRKIDVTSTESIQSFESWISESGLSIISLHSLAGRALPSEFEGLSTPLDDIPKSIYLNLTAHIIIVCALRGVIASNGSVCLISSINALRNFGLPAYSAAKAGLHGFVHAAAQELGARGIRLNAIAPGTVVTPATLAEPKDFDLLLKGTLLGRLTTTTEVAHLAYELSENFTAITGQTVVADCGQILGISPI